MRDVVKAVARRTRALLGGLALLLIAGCVTPGSWFGFLSSDPGDERPCRVMSYWDRTIRLAPDTKSHPMQEIPCLAGRVYFFGPEAGHLLTPRGTLIVDWYDMSGPPDGPHALLGECVIDPDSLQKFKSVNLVGIGYSIPVPWQGYRPEYTHVKIQMAFLPERGGDPIYAEPSVVSLQNDQAVTISSRKEMVVPAPR
jgi:hypothetical protein